MGLLCLVYMILALRTNIVFVLIFATLTPAFGLLAAAYWYLAEAYAGDATAAAKAGKLQIAGGAFTFITCLCGWWIFFAIMLAALDFPFSIPGTQITQWYLSALQTAY